MSTCTFSKAWVGKCGQLAVEDNRCEEHKGLVCSSCGASATHNCDATMGPMVCGFDLCDDCEHTIRSNGCNSGGELPEGYKGHCKKGTQVYKSWMSWSPEERQAIEERKHQEAKVMCKRLLDALGGEFYGTIYEGKDGSGNPAVLVRKKAVNEILRRLTDA